jgi:hypothetical protein
MATLEVAQPFSVRLDPIPMDAEVLPGARGPTDPTVYQFPTPGTYSDVPDEVATHAYTQPNLVGYEAPPFSLQPADTVVMQPDPEPPPTGDEALDALSTDQREEIVQQRRTGQRRPEYGARSDRQQRADQTAEHARAAEEQQRPTREA